MSRIMDLKCGFKSFSRSGDFEGFFLKNGHVFCTGGFFGSNRSAIIIIIKIRHQFQETALVSPMASPEVLGGETKSAPIPAHRSGGHPDPPPTSVILHLTFARPLSKSLTGCAEVGCRMMGDGGGGSGGRGVRSRARVTAPGLPTNSCPLPQTLPDCHE